MGPVQTYQSGAVCENNRNVLSADIPQVLKVETIDRSRLGILGKLVPVNVGADRSCGICAYAESVYITRHIPQGSMQCNHRSVPGRGK